MLGSYTINPSKNYPQKIATAIADMKIFGCTYEAVAYLGSQQVNGTNHAVLAEQTVTNGEDTKNAVILVFNEKADSNDVSLVNVISVAESGGKLGGTQISVSADVPAEAKEAFENVLAGFVGNKFEIVAFVGTKITKGTDFKFVVTSEAVVPDAKKRLALFTANTMTGFVVEPLLEGGESYHIVKSAEGLEGYKKLGKPLGEWP